MLISSRTDGASVAFVGAELGADADFMMHLYAALAEKDRNVKQDGK